jgi:hypothetical protein
MLSCQFSSLWTVLRPGGYTWPYVACRIGQQVPIRQPPRTRPGASVLSAAGVTQAQGRVAVRQAHDDAKGATHEGRQQMTRPASGCARPQPAADPATDSAANAQRPTGAAPGGAALTADGAVPAAAADARPPPYQLPRGIKLPALRSCPTTWDPASVSVAVNARLDGRIVACASGGARVSYRSGQRHGSAVSGDVDGRLDRPPQRAKLGRPNVGAVGVCALAATRWCWMASLTTPRAGRCWS